VAKFERERDVLLSALRSCELLLSNTKTTHFVDSMVLMQVRSALAPYEPVDPMLMVRRLVAESMRLRDTQAEEKRTELAKEGKE